MKVVEFEMSRGISSLDRPLVGVGGCGMWERLLVEGTLEARAGGSSGDLNQAACRALTHHRGLELLTGLCESFLSDRGGSAVWPLT